MAKAKLVTFTVEMELSPLFDNRTITKVLKPQMELALKREQAAGVRILKTYIAPTKKGN